MSTRAVLLAAVVTGLLLGVVGTRADGPAGAGPPRRDGSVAQTGR
ncbi:hypothetical protein [Streptomyces sp. VRA16 Mangrove soil]|nr:hypothetical protein [Streptomyces sp. VRA16 Mangrove soil]